MKTSLRDHAAELHGTADIKMTKQDQADMVTGLRRQTLERIYHITLVTSATKAEKYDRIEQIIVDLGNNIRTVISTPTVD